MCFVSITKIIKSIHAVLFFVLQTLETAIEGDELVFLYQVKNGICQSSCAANIATLAGIPDDLVRRGVEVRHRNTFKAIFYFAFNLKVALYMLSHAFQYKGV